MKTRAFDQKALTHLKTRGGAGPHKDKRRKRGKPRAIAKRRAWELE